LTILQRLRRLLNRITRPSDPEGNRTYVPLLNSGMRVDHDTAMQFGAVFRAVNYISSQVAMMPWRVMLETNGRKDLVSTHHVDKLLHKRPNPEMSAFAFRETLIAHALTWGNGYAEIERDSANRPVALWPISPDRVEVKRDDAGQIIYEITGSNERRYLDSDSMFHLHGMGFDGLSGYSVVNLARRAISVGMAAEQMGASFFENGTVTNIVIEHPEAFGETAYKNFKDSLLGWMQGPKKAFNPLIVEEGIKASSLTMPFDDAQFLETRQFQVDEIARWFGLPPHKLQSLDNATFSNIEQQAIEVVTDALQPWVIRLEQEADYKLFSKRGSFYTKINMNSLLRGDMAARSTFYREMWNLGVLSTNDIRELEDMNPVPYGEKRFVQLNMTTLEKAGEEAEMPEPVEPEQDTEDIDEIAAKIARREEFRLRDATVRFKDDRDGFVNWMVNYFEEHERYCLKAFLDISIDASEAISKRIPDARLSMLEHFDTGAVYSVEQTAAELSAAIVEIKYGNDKPKRLSN
jgi:HK97 family phage portal protein